MSVVALAALTLVFGYAVFRYGGVLNQDWYLCLTALGIVYAALRVAPRRVDALPRLPLVVRVLIGGLLAVVVLQLIPLPVGLVNWITPARAELDRALGEVLGASRFTTLTIVPAETFRLLLTLAGYVIVFLLAREMGWRWRHSPWIPAVPFIAVGLLEAVLGLVQYYGVRAPLATGTYINRNHYSGLLEMTLPFAVMGGIALLRAGEPARSRRSPAGPAIQASLSFAVAAVILLAILQSLSRMGFIAALGSLFVMGAAALGAGLSGRKRVVPVAVVAVLVIAGFIFLPTDQLIERFATVAATEDISADTRAQIWSDTFEQIVDYPILGCGLGCYESGFYRYKTVAPMNTVDFAHNDYLQLTAELGFVGILILLALAVRLFARATEASGRPPRTEERYLGIACLGSLTAIALHSMVDFNLYIPSNAMLLSWIAGVTEGLAFQSYQESRPRLRTRAFAVATPSTRSAV